MKFISTKLPGAFLVEPIRLEDDRGFFARTWSPADFTERGLNAELAQCSISFNKRKGTLRGMHYQIAPHQEVKLVRCTMGAIYDVLVDLREESPTFKQWIAAELTADNRRMLYVPAGIAHGFQTLQASSEVFYQISTAYAHEYARGVRWNDPAFGIEWPPDERTIIARDESYSDFTL